MLLALTMLAAVMLDWRLGEPRRFHPLVGFGRLATWLEARLNPPSAQPGTRQRLVGLLTVLALLTPTTLLAGWLATLPVLGSLWAVIALYFASRDKEALDPASATCENVRANLTFLRAQGWENAIRRHLRYGGKVIGLCGGYHMLGQSVDEPYGIEGEPGTSAGLGWLDIHTVLEPEKQLRRVTGQLCLGDALLEGYEIHAGGTRGAGLSRPAALLEGGPDGAISADGQVLGTYVHGLFDRPEACAALLSWAGLKSEQSAPDMAWLREQGIERLADNVEEHLDMERIITILDGQA